jgi:hypothetical protein
MSRGFGTGRRDRLYSDACMHGMVRVEYVVCTLSRQGGHDHCPWRVLGIGPHWNVGGSLLTPCVRLCLLPIG